MSSDIQSTADHGKFLFAQDLGNGMVHLSFSGVSEKPLNIRIPSSDLSRMIENLVRCMDRLRISAIAERNERQ
jgi:hypothetical protein